MVLDQTTYFEKGVQNLIDVLREEDFRKRIEKLGSYDFKDSGKILYSAS
jgi:mannitol/fructose-specific phosphotransferase system IIA component (Ntr-type)